MDHNYLHSTIFILKLQYFDKNDRVYVFTFYYIYIKTHYRTCQGFHIQYLHSTIFILKRKQKKRCTNI